MPNLGCTYKFTVFWSGLYFIDKDGNARRRQVLRLQSVQRTKRPRGRRRSVAQCDARVLRHSGARLRIQVRLPGAAAVKDRPFVVVIDPLSVQ